MLEQAYSIYHEFITYKNWFHTVVKLPDNQNLGIHNYLKLTLISIQSGSTLS